MEGRGGGSHRAQRRGPTTRWRREGSSASRPPQVLLHAPRPLKPSTSAPPTCNCKKLPRGCYHRSSSAPGGLPKASPGSGRHSPLVIDAALVEEGEEDVEDEEDADAAGIGGGGGGG